ncbi:Transcription factor spt8 [Friedmanniomyces endolithicus]|nr:Transcription factor spt8 [Friedmanniomyces endolithicus]KAK0874550.1 Transcription factor spt8 [Friedmanniomyces endolithicus]
MADFDDADPAAEDEFENEDEEMEDANEADQDGDADADQDVDAQGDDDEDEDQDNDEDDNGDEEDEDEQPESPSRPPGRAPLLRQSPIREPAPDPAAILTSPSTHHAAARSPRAGIVASYIPPTRPEALKAQAYEIIPTMAAPQGTSINAVAATPDMRWVFSGGTDGYVRMFNWVETANGKVPLTVAQKHPFVDSVMKAGSLLTYWENEDASMRTPNRGDEAGKWTSPVYSLAVQHEALWLLSGLESGGINLQTCRHQAGTPITTLKEHTSAVSVLALSHNEMQLLSGSWDKNIHDWDLNTGKLIRSFHGADGQISAVEVRPASDVSVPEVSQALPEPSNGTLSSNNADRPLANGVFMNGFDNHSIKGDEADAAGSPNGSLFGDNDVGENDHGSLFGEDNAAASGNVFGEEDDELTRALANDIQETDQDAPGEFDVEMGGVGAGGPVQPPGILPFIPPGADVDGDADADDEPDSTRSAQMLNGAGPAAASIHQSPTNSTASTSVPNGLPHAHEPLTAPPTDESIAHTNSTTTAAATSTADLPPQSESTFLSTSIDGTIRIWDRRVSQAVAVLKPWDNTPPWCTGACWSPDGNTFFAGRRNNTVDEYEIRKLSSSRNEPSRQFRFQAGSGPVYAVRAMPNSRHLVCASQDILRIYDLQHESASASSRGRASATPFTILPGHRGGVISAIHVDPRCRFMLSVAGNRGWEGSTTEVLLGYEIGVLDEEGENIAPALQLDLRAPLDPMLASTAPMRRATWVYPTTIAITSTPLPQGCTSHSGVP